ncbi:hypothetical protein [Maridesulfovibrio sp.]|nr:hypothetical protein [Maridesulfovibrio sp.]
MFQKKRPEGWEVPSDHLGPVEVVTGLGDEPGLAADAKPGLLYNNWG